MQKRTSGLVFLMICCLAAPAFSADRVIQNGIDVWETKGDGLTYIDFAKTPIPAGFFCTGSTPFTGRLELRGEPVVTDVPGALGKADTIIQRLDDAVFNKRNRAVTRLQFRALSLKGLAPIETSCGSFAASVRLDGVQPITRMVITREDEDGGRFSAPLALNVKVSFTPLGSVSREAFELPVEVRFPANPNFPWRSKAVAPVPAGFVRVDTDGDLKVDTYLPGTSNFIAGQSSRPVHGQGVGGTAKIGGGQWICHDDETGKQHCTWLCSGCQIP